MSKEIQPKQTSLNPYAGGGIANNSAPVVSQVNAVTSIETQRALAEVQAAVMMAIQYPRNPMASVDSMLGECQRVSFAEKAVYSYARGGTTITGLSIHSLKMIARNWKNIRSGFRILDRSGGVSSIHAFAYDLESNTYEQRDFQVKHFRGTKKGGYVLTDERDIYELEANQAQRRVRSCIEALIPADVKDAVMDAVNTTMNASADTSKEGVKKMLSMFAEFGINQKMIEAKIQRKAGSIEASQMVNLRNIYLSLKDDMSTPESWFDMDLATEEKKPVKKITEEKPKDLASFKENNAQELKPSKEKNVDKLPDENCKKCKGRGVVDNFDKETGELVDVIKCECLG